MRRISFSSCLEAPNEQDHLVAANSVDFKNGVSRGVVWEVYYPGLHRRSLELDRLTPG